MIIGSKIFHKNTCYNSIDWAKENIDLAPDGAVFLADIQEYTHGRQKRIWKSYPGQIIATILLKPKILNQINKENLELRLNQLNMAITLGIFESLKDYKITIKWPNDFMYENKKVGGLLLDLVWLFDKPKAIIASFAINSNNLIMEQDNIFDIATSLTQIINQKIDNKVLLSIIFKNIDFYYKKWLNSEFEDIYNTWKINQSYLNKNIKIHRFDGSTKFGFLKNILPNGDIVFLDKQNNKEENISFYVVEQISG